MLKELETRRSWVTQRMANSYPPWSRVRQLAQSVGQQMLESLGREMEDLYWWSNYDLGNYLLNTCDVDEADNLYRLMLPPTFEFDTKNNTNSTIYLTPTSVRAQLSSGSWITLQQATENSFEEFWYGAPDRITTEGTSYTYRPVVPLSQVINLSNTVPTPPPFASKIWVTLTNLGSTFKVYKGSQQRSKVEINGYDLAGKEATETIVFAFDGSIQTKTTWSDISTISTEYVEETAFLRADWLTVGQSTFVDYFGLHIIEDREKFRFYSLGNIDTGSTLRHQVFSAPDLNTVQEGNSSKETVYEAELLDSSENSFFATWFTTWPKRRWVVATADDSAHFFLPNIKMENLSPLIERSAEPILQIYTNSEWTVKGNTITLDYNLKRPLYRILKTRWSVEKPDGTRVGIAPSGSEIAYSVSGWEENRAANRFNKVGFQGEQIEYIITSSGRYVFYLESLISDDLSKTSRYAEQMDIKVLHSSSMAATSSISLPISLGDITSVSFDPLGRPWAMSVNGTVHLLDFHYDKYLVDFESKIIFLRENYSSVEVEV